MNVVNPDALAIITIWQEASGEPYTGKETYCLCGVDWPTLSKKLGRRIELDSDGIDYIAHPPP